MKIEIARRPAGLQCCDENPKAGMSTSRYFAKGKIYTALSYSVMVLRRTNVSSTSTGRVWDAGRSGEPATTRSPAINSTGKDPSSMIDLP